MSYQLFLIVLAIYVSTAAPFKHGNPFKHKNSPVNIIGSRNQSCLYKSSEMCHISSSQSINPGHPWWVNTLNHSLEKCPGSTLLAFVSLDMLSVAAIWCILEGCKLQISVDFIFAYIIAKAFRIQRLAFDAAGAKFLTKRFPNLAGTSIELPLSSSIIINFWALIPFFIL